MGLDAEGRVTAIGESYGGAGPYTSQYAYNQNDLPTLVTLPGNVTEAAGYDANSALTSLVAQGPNTGATTTTLCSAYGYGYKAAGWITGTTTFSGTDAIAPTPNTLFTDTGNWTGGTLPVAVTIATASTTAAAPATAIAASGGHCKCMTVSANPYAPAPKKPT